MSKKLTEQTFKGFIWLFTGSGLQVLLKIGVLAVLARLLTPEDFGVVGIATTIIEFSKLFSHMGVGPALVQLKEIGPKHLRAAFSISLFWGLFLGGLLYLLAPFLALFFRMEKLEEVLKVVSLIFLVDSFTLVGQALMQRGMKFKELAVIELGAYIIGYGLVGITTAKFNWGVWGLVAANLTQGLAMCFLITVRQPFPKMPVYDKGIYKELLHYGLGMTIARLGNFIAIQGDNLVVGRTLGAGWLGIYSRAYQFMVMPSSLFGNALDKSLFPAMSKVQDEKQKLASAFLTGTGTIAIVAIPISVVFIILAPEIILFLLGSKWAEVVMPFRILAAGLVFRMNYKISDSLARATGAVYKRAWRQILYAIAVLCGSYIGHFWGVKGVAIGVVGALILNYIFMCHLSIKITSISWTQILGVQVKGLRNGAIVGVLTLVNLFIASSIFTTNLLILFVTLGGLSLSCSVLFFYYPDIFLQGEQQKLLTRLIGKRFLHKKLQVV